MKNHYLTILNLFKKKESKKLLIDVLKEYINKYNEENVLTEGTKLRYEAYYKNISMFLHSTKQFNIAVDDIRVRTAEELRFWLHKHLMTCCVSYSSRHLEILKRVTRYACLMEYIQNDPLSPVKTGRDKPKSIIYLEDRELKRIINAIFNSEIYSIVRDLFLFQCYTGLSYADIYSYELIEREGQLWLSGKRQKTQKDNNVFVFPEAYRIYLKYSGELPAIANQTYNRMLKEIAGQLSIKKNLTTHIGRKTHAMLLSKQGVSTKAISIQLANTEQICNQSYIDGSASILQNEISRLGLTKKLIFNS